MLRFERTTFTTWFRGSYMIWSVFYFPIIKMMLLKGKVCDKLILVAFADTRQRNHK